MSLLSNMMIVCLSLGSVGDCWLKDDLDWQLSMYVGKEGSVQTSVDKNTSFKQTVRRPHLVVKAPVSPGRGYCAGL